MFLVATVVVAVVVGVLFVVFLESTRKAIVSRSDDLRDSAARDIGARVASELGVATHAIDELERAVRVGAVDLDDPVAVEAVLFTGLLNHPTLSDLTLVHADRIGYAADGAVVLAPGDRWQISLFRLDADPDSAIHTRHVWLEDGRFRGEKRERPRGGTLLSAPFAPDLETTDPTARPAFQVAASATRQNGAVWTDLHFSQFDAALPPSKRRVAVDLARAVDDSAQQFVGVVRAGLLTRTIDALPNRALGDGRAGDPRRAFLCDSRGRLVTRLDANDPLEQVGDDVRVAPVHEPGSIREALASPILSQITHAQPQGSTGLDVAGERFLATFRLLEGTPGWLVGIVAPENYYTQDLESLRKRFMGVYLAVTLVVLLGGGLALRVVERGLGSIRRATTRMRHFDFTASDAKIVFRDVDEVVDELERAKTAMRALSKYVPIDLVRELHESNREPVLGGELVQLSIMFSDIQGFTSLSEGLAPDALAQALGRYLEAMTTAIRETDGTVDKFIGDAVMTFWNAPTPYADHAKRACRAALGCMRAARELYASPAWKPLPPLVTRFGIHTATVMVGHFGAPDRLSYTALGDGVNVASRLESLCKQYDLTSLVSESIFDAAKDEFSFRLVDRVAVKGKHEAVGVYELLGRTSDAKEARADVETYEAALERYSKRDFAGSIALLEPRQADGPSRVLLARCKVMLVSPPPDGWDGVFVATSK
jgi:adenylate cyclase